MDQRSVVKISVRALVEFVMQSGDLQSGFCSSTRMVEGIKAHHVISSSSGEEYIPEVAVTYLLERDGIYLEVNGRIDGVIKSGDSVTINEVKSTAMPIENITENFNPQHWAQAKCYAYIYGMKNLLDTVRVQLTYYQIDTSEIKCFSRDLTIVELETFFLELVDEYLQWIGAVQQWNELRNSSIAQLGFPFQSYRKGQRELAGSVYRAIRDENRLFAQAPTGTGKTSAVLFPAIKALGEGLTSKIFYLTAKTITRTIAEKAVDNMRKKGLRIKTVTITAKDKVCFNSETACNPEDCEYVRGYYDRINKAIEDIFRFDSFTRPVIEEYAKKHCICPFEFSLDLSTWSDCIICDYNYVFDPRVSLKRYFMYGGGDYAFLIDEAHNLVDRAREMFSAELTKKPVLDLKRSVKSELPKLSKLLNEINSFLIKSRKTCEEENQNFHVDKEAPKELLPLLRSFVRMADNWLSKNQPASFNEPLLDLYFSVMSFIRVSECYDDRYVTYYEASGNDLKVKMFCLDPSYQLQQAMKRGKAAVLFSATLTPMNYFIKVLGGGEEAVKLRLPSPFPRENLCLLVDDRVSTKYKLREFTFDRVTQSISAAVGGKVGNYLVFFPSYRYMNEVYARFVEVNPGVRTIYQRSTMTETEREEFLLEFSSPGSETLVGFAVMGGVFGEGIDLTGDFLSGAVIVGVGLPQVCLEREIIRKHFEEEQGLGFEFAYIFPGMNKVMQAVGRVIRTEEDRGVVLLVDERFSHSTYRELYPPEWHPVIRVKDKSMIAQVLDDFWSG